MADIKQLTEMFEPAIIDLGYTLWGMEHVAQGKYSTLTIYIDSEDGINVDDCAKVSHQVSGILDVEDPITSKFTLEVSSPGLDRPLFTKDQFEQYVDQFIRVRLHYAFENRRKFAGVLTGVEGDDVVVLVDQEEYLLPIESIARAHVDSSITVTKSGDDYSTQDLKKKRK